MMGEPVNFSEPTASPDLYDIPGRREWEVLYPTVRDVLFADINGCPPHLRHHYELPLLDGDFVMPTKPYLYLQHQNFLKTVKKDGRFDTLMKEYLKGPGSYYWKHNESRDPQADDRPSTSQNKSFTKVTTTRPELGAFGGAGVKFIFDKCISRDFSVPSPQAHEGPSEESNYQTFCRNLEFCRDWIILEKAITTRLLETDFISVTNKSLINLEDSLFDMATYPNCCDGIFYLSAFIVEKHIYIRYMESGAYKGSFSNIVDALSPSLPKDGISGIVRWQTYNEHDIALHCQSEIHEHSRKRRKTDSRTSRKDEAYTRLLSTNAHSVRSSLTKLEQQNLDSDDCKLLGVVVHTKYRGHEQILDDKVGDRWFLNCGGQFSVCVDDVEHVLKEFPTQSIDVAQLRDHTWIYTDLPTRKPTLSEQCDTISLLPNFPSGTAIRRFDSRFSVTSRGCPQSLRNRALWSFSHHHRSQQLYQCYEDLTNVTDIPPSSVEHVPVGNPLRNEHGEGVVRRFTLESLQRSLKSHPNINLAPNMMSTNFSIYENYTTKLVEHGTVHWRLCSNVLDTFVLNNYDSESGNFKPFEYIHCSRVAVETGFHYVCDCEIYHTLSEQCELENTDIANSDVSCVHCRLLRTLPLGGPTVIHKLSKIDSFFFKSRESIGKSIVYCPGSTDTHKFSVISDDVCTFVHLSKNISSGKYSIACQSGRCNLKKGAKRTVTFLDRGILCPHLNIMRDNMDAWKHLLPETCPHDSSDEDETAEQVDEVAPPLNCENNNAPEDSFDVETGLWNFKCVSKHQAVADKSEKLSKCIQDRDELNDRNPLCSPRVEGCLRGPDLVPPIPATSCPCQANWVDHDHPQGFLSKSRVLTLYTLHAPVTCCVYKRLCAAGQCEELWDEGCAQCIHVSTQETCAGDEIGWLFVDRILSGRQSFSGFCKEMTNNYQRRCPDSRKFMSPNVFIQWWFSWAANQKGDFRKPCPVCKFSPKVLGCDGTKIGIVFRHQQVSPIEKPDSEDILPTIHRRNDRCFLFYRPDTLPETIRAARENLLFLTQYICGNIAGQEQDTLLEKYHQVLDELAPECQPAFTRLCTSEEISENEKSALCEVFKLMSSTAPVSVVLPFMYVQEVSSLIDHVTGAITINNGPALFNRVLSHMRAYAPELRELFAASAADNEPVGSPHPDVVQLMRYIMDRVRLLHEANTPPEDAIPQQGTYNPPKLGRAYYFSESGCKLRNIRKFSIDDEKKSSNYDDAPSSFEKCTKVFPDVTKKGTSHLFLWFCPLHGHCYGFHIIPGSEGRKDPSASLYMHLETPPSVIFYDFACNLHEYCMNRESGFYKDVRFYHDIFHGFTHKCTVCYKSSRLIGFEQVNSEIAEQFNSFIQSIKYPAKQMSQVHFVFFIQYFVDLWNERKEKKHLKKLAIAAQGAL